MWNPPWTLAFTLPFGLLSFNLGQFAWLFSQLLFILLCTQALANLYGGGSTNCRIEWCVALSFVPTVFVLIIGQISPMVLAGISGFLVLERKGKSLAAGAMLAVVAIKPHLLYLFWLALFLVDLPIPPLAGSARRRRGISHRCAAAGLFRPSYLWPVSRSVSSARNPQTVRLAGADIAKYFSAVVRSQRSVVGELADAGWNCLAGILLAPAQSPVAVAGSIAVSPIGFRDDEFLCLDLRSGGSTAGAGRSDRVDQTNQAALVPLLGCARLCCDQWHASRHAFLVRRGVCLLMAGAGIDPLLCRLSL